MSLGAKSCNLANQSRSVESFRSNPQKSNALLADFFFNLCPMGGQGSLSPSVKAYAPADCNFSEMFARWSVMEPAAILNFVDSYTSRQRYLSGITKFGEVILNHKRSSYTRGRISVRRFDLELWPWPLCLTSCQISWKWDLYLSRIWTSATNERTKQPTTGQFITIPPGQAGDNTIIAVIVIARFCSCNCGAVLFLFLKNCKTDFPDIWHRRSASASVLTVDFWKVGDFCQTILLRARPQIVVFYIGPWIANVIELMPRLCQLCNS